mgnify:CR=1 FL=1
MTVINRNNKQLILTENNQQYIVEIEHVIKKKTIPVGYKLRYLYNLTRKEKFGITVSIYKQRSEVENMETLDMFMLENILNL